MALTLTLTTKKDGEQPQIIARIGETGLATTALANLPNRAQALADPYTHGPALFAALGGEALLIHLNSDQDRLLYLDIASDDDEADGLAWECAMGLMRWWIKMARHGRPIGSIFWPRCRPSNGY